MDNVICGLVPLVVCAALVALIWKRRSRSGEKGASRGDASHAAAFAVLLAALAVMGFAGLVDSLAGDAVASAVAGVCGACMLRRSRVLAWFGRRSVAVRALRDAVVLAICMLVGFVSIELPWNTELACLESPWLVNEIAVIALGVVALYFLAGRRGTLIEVGLIACAGIGLAEYFVLMFRGVLFLPRDLYALGTAAAVAGNYRYALSFEALVVVACVCAGTALLAFVRPARNPQRAPKHPRLASWPASAALGLCLALVCSWVLLSPDYLEEEIKLDYWTITKCFRAQGFVPTFTAAVQDMKIRKPDGYTQQEAQEKQAALAASYDEAHGTEADKALRAQFEEVKPSVVVVMNESFTDLSVFEELGVGYQGPEFFKSADNGAFAQGPLSVSAFGGGTANTEFEFLTGISLLSVGSGKYPFQMYHMGKVPSIARDFAQLGYGTVGMHPNLPDNWRRREVYPELGFETCLFIEDFEGAQEYHNGVSDAETYDKVLQILEDNDEPQFIFDVTMQNHSGYTMGNIPEKDLPGISVPGADDELNGEVNEYLACIHNSDEALGELVKKLQELDEPVVLAFFGDHHPLFSGDLNGMFFPGEEGPANLHRVQQTVYGIWTNYDISGTETGGAREKRGEKLSASNLGAYLLESMGAPLTEHEKATLQLRESIPQMDVFGYRGENGTWYFSTDESPYSENLAEYLHVEYLNFGETAE